MPNNHTIRLFQQFISIFTKYFTDRNTFYNRLVHWNAFTLRNHRLVPNKRIGSRLFWMCDSLQFINAQFSFVKEESTSISYNTSPMVNLYWRKKHPVTHVCDTGCYNIVDLLCERLPHIFMGRQPSFSSILMTHFIYIY